MLVWKAMPSMTPMMSAILRAESLIADMVPTTFCTTVPPWVATSEALTARALACRAFSALSFTVLVISSMLDAVSSRLDACCSVRVDSSELPLAISPAAVLMVSAASRICPSICARLTAVLLE
ncbi:MAG: hypothetical protein GAK45_01605 [Pseudomonas citronellolis]|nr:MAG: hypothetical protein GAK45_01605 [Pseudomonas citronellolis]